MAYNGKCLIILFKRLVFGSKYSFSFFPFLFVCLFVCVRFDGFLELRAWHDVFQMKAINRMLMPPHAGLDEDIDFE